MKTNTQKIQLQKFYKDTTPNQLREIAKETNALMATYISQLSQVKKNNITEK